MKEFHPLEVVTIDYTNHRGERSIRRIVPVKGGMHFDATPWHPMHQWLLKALDIDKDDYRDFAVKDIHSWRSGDRVQPK